MVERDAHHLFHRRAEWEATPEALHLRESIVARDMLRGYHQRLHNETAPVPVPLYHSLQWISHHFQPHGDVFQRVDDVSFLLEQANHLRRVQPIEVQVNTLALQALREQLPFVRDGLPTTSTVIDLGSHHE